VQRDREDEPADGRQRKPGDVQHRVTGERERKAASIGRNSDRADPATMVVEEPLCTVKATRRFHSPRILLRCRRAGARERRYDS